MDRSAARNASLVLMLAAFPLISIGTTSDRPAMWWIGLASLALGALIPPVLRFVPAPERAEDKEQAERRDKKEKERERRRHAPDLGDSSRVC